MMSRRSIAVWVNRSRQGITSHRVTGHQVPIIAPAREIANLCIVLVPGSRWVFCPWHPDMLYWMLNLGLSSYANRRAGERMSGIMKPKLRGIDARPIQHQGQSMVLLRDPLNLSDAAIAVPQALVPLLAFMDGTRDEAELEAALLVRVGVRLAPGLLPQLLADLDEAYLLENHRYLRAKARALQSYREASSRAMTLDSAGFPTDPDQASVELQGYVDSLVDTVPAAQRDHAAKAPCLRGLVSPHIDYQRGGAVYAQVWQAAAEAAKQADLVVILGTDHQGGEGTLTLTCQSYATPWGVLPTDKQVVRRLAQVLGEGAVFDEELHHRAEHSIELVAVWLHFIRAGEPVPVVPILCGSFATFVAGASDPADHEPFRQAISVLQSEIAARRTLVVAAADLAHMGPAFGDSVGLDPIGQAQLQNADERLLACVYDGDATAFFETLQAEGDRRHVCGLPPIYLTLRLLEDIRGEPAGYALCPADPQGTSYVSIAGALLW